jgi:lysine 2,3-aminomutase
MNGNSLTTLGASLFEVDEARFSDWRWQMAHQIRDTDKLASILALNSEDHRALVGAWEASRASSWPAGITPYLATLLRAKNLSPALTRQFLPAPEEFAAPSLPRDPLAEEAQSPVPEVIHLYPDRVAFTVAEVCPAYCRVCFRKRRGQREGHHFHKETIERALAYIRRTPAIRDVLITGGDPFLASDEALDRLLSRLREIPHVEIIRLGTRTLSTLPYRASDTLARVLSRHHPVFVSSHFNCAEEVSPEAGLAIERLVNAGIMVNNQAVLLRGVNDSAQAQIALGRELLKHRCRPYYLFHAHRVVGTSHLRTSLDLGTEILRQVRGNISGLGIPTYVVDTPSGKIPLSWPHRLGSDGSDILLEDIRGAIWRETSAVTDA